MHKAVYLYVWATLLSLCSYAFADYQYAITVVQGLGGDGDFAWAINDRGHVVGSSFVARENEFHAFLWDGFEVTDLGTFGGQDSKAWDINNLDEVVGWASQFDGTVRAFVWRGEALIDLGTLGGTESDAHGINDTGQIVGSSGLPGDTESHGFLWEDGVMQDLGTLAGNSSHARDVSRSGRVTGYSSVTNVGWRAVIWEPDGTIIDLGSLGDGTNESLGVAINDAGFVVGQSTGVGPNSQRRAFVSNGNEMRNLARHGQHMGGAAIAGRSINNSSQIVGPFRHRADDELHGFVFTPGQGMETIETLLPPNHGWWIEVPTDINDRGQISAWGHPEGGSSFGETRSFIITPVTPEMMLTVADGPLRADAINALVISNAQPNATVKFYYGKRGGGKFIPGCDALAAMLQIDDPVLFGEASADANGNAQLDIFIPARAASHKGFLIQAVDFANCTESQLVLKQVE